MEFCRSFQVLKPRYMAHCRQLLTAGWARAAEKSLQTPQRYVLGRPRLGLVATNVEKLARAAVSTGATPVPRRSPVVSKSATVGTQGTASAGGNNSDA